MNKPRLLVLSLGGTITMVPSETGGIAPKLGAAELVASVPALADVAEIEAHSPFRLPSPSLTPGNLIDVARTIEEGFAAGFDGAVVIQGTDTIEESAFILDLLVGGEKPVVVTGAMRGADAPGADGPANLLAAARVAAAREARGLGTVGVLNYDIHAARLCKSLTQPCLRLSPRRSWVRSAPSSRAGRGSLSACRERRPCRPPTGPRLPSRSSNGRWETTDA